MIFRFTATLTAAVAALAPTGIAFAAVPMPPASSGFSNQIEAAQPYVGQTTCDPVAKPGLVAFRELLLRSYPGTGSLGIVLDCGAAGQTEHKEGRAFDWAVSINNPQQVAQVNEVMTWLTQPDRYGNQFAMAKRLGLMYMIWNSRMWRSYNNGTYAANTWSPYTGSSRHTDHVHFSFGWNGAQKATSFWNNGVVAPVYYGPSRPGGSVSVPVPVPVVVRITPLVRVSNAGVVASFGQTSLVQGSSGEAVKVLQRALQVTVDGSFGPQSAAAVSGFQGQQGLPVTGRWSPSDWLVLFPVPAAFPVLAANAAVLRDFGQLTVSVGASGAAVSAVQRALKIPADGSFGPQTAGAVTRLQTEQEIAVTGSWGPREWQLAFPALVPVPFPVAPLQVGVSLTGAPRQSPAYGSEFVLSGKATAGALVTLHFRKAGAPAGEYAIVRTVRADAMGRWSRPILANVDYRYYATTDNSRSATVLNTPTPTVDGPASRRIPLRVSYRLTGQAVPHSTVLLNFHNADMAPGDYGVVRAVTADASGSWSRSYVPTQDCRVFASLSDGATSSASAVLLQAR